jgi:bifunctional non-homologous end joining protein LigD
MALARSKRASPSLEPPPGAKPGPLPDFIAPCLATLVSDPPDGENWVHEIKFDGYRIQAHVERGRVKLFTRSGQDWTPRFGALAKALGALKVKDALIDGEAVVMDEAGVSRFVELVADLKAGRSNRMVYYAFDLLHLDGSNLEGAALADRKARLAKVLESAPKGGAIRYSDHVQGDGRELLAKACSLGLEGIISKRTDKPYRSGRRDDWTKAKCIQNDEFVIGGYLDSTAYPKAIGALVLGYYERRRLIYAGRVGTGFDRRTARELWRMLQPLRRESSPFADPLDAEQRRAVKWVRPMLVAQIEYRAWTGDGLLRHASFQALREDKPATEVRRPKGRA